MPTVRFTRNIQRHVECPPAEVAGATVREALDAYFADRVQARSYVLDDRACLRQHMVVFIDGRTVVDRQALSDPVESGAMIDVMQALSGG